MNSEINIAAVGAAALQHGLISRGGFTVDADDDVPDVDGKVAKSLLLFGNGGSSLWAGFSNSAEYHDHQPNPLNRWSARIGNQLAEQFGARALFPFGGPPRLPFLRWAKKAEALQNSQLGMLIHPQFGLWHAYRFALAFPQRGDPAQVEWQTPAASDRDICQRCATKPCRGACPVNAFTEAGYDVQSCFRYLEDNPKSACMTHGCQARTACPQGTGYRYEPRHAAFHMRAFVVAMATEEFSEDATGRVAGEPDAA